jgi:hypothetical protein
VRLILLSQLATDPSTTTKTGRHDIAEILLKVALKHKKITKTINHYLPLFTCGYQNTYIIAVSLPLLFVYLLTSIYLHGAEVVLIFSYIVAVSFIGGGNRSKERKPPACH